MKPLPHLSFVLITLGWISFSHAGKPPTKSASDCQGIQKLSTETKATIQLAFAKAKQTPKAYQLQRANLYHFEHKIHYHVELEGKDGSIWRTVVSESKETGKQSVNQFTRVSEPEVIFKPFVSAKKKRS